MIDDVAALLGDRRADFPTAVHMLAEAAARTPDHIAMISGDQQISYGDYVRCIAALAHNLIALGAKGERVQVLKANSIETSIAAFATWAAGGQLVLLNPLYTIRELEPLVRDAAPHVILCDAPFVEMMSPVSKSAGVSAFQVFEDEGLSIANWLKADAHSLPTDLPQAGDVGLLAYTGGTTGLPKAAVHTHKMLMALTRSIEASWPTTIGGDIWLSVAPQSHMWGWCMTLLLPVYGGNTVVNMPKFHPELVLEALVRHRVTIFAGGPSAIYYALMNVDGLKSSDLSALRLCAGGGSPFAVEMVKAWHQFTGLTIHESYGMSEGGPISNNRTDRPNKIGSVGIAAPGTDVQIVDIETGNTVLPTGETGEIRTRGPQMVESYWRRPDETAETICDGWVYSGDVGHIDDEGFIFISDRKKDMAVVGGYNVFPREIDEVLYACDTVQEATTIGVPDDYMGEVIHAFIVLKPGAPSSVEIIQDFCRQRLAKYKIPADITFLDALPKTPAAKIDKLTLRAMAGGAPKTRR